MFEFLSVILFFWLLAKAVGLAWRLSWGLTKIAVSILMAVALPMMVVCVVFAGGIVLFAPLAVIGIALGILKACT